ncbi:MAG: DNA-processing protein DprA [bacterium]
MPKINKKYICIVGSRLLACDMAGKVRSVVSHLLHRGFAIGSGGAFGADLFARSRALVEGSAGLVAFISGPSRGTWFTCHYAAQRGLRVVVFASVISPASIMLLGAGRWVPLSGLWAGSYQWVPNLSGNCKHGIITFEYFSYCKRFSVRCRVTNSVPHALRC